MSHDTGIRYEPDIDAAFALATRDIRAGMGADRLGCRGIGPSAAGGYATGVRLTDAVWPFIDGMVYWHPPSDCHDYLFSHDDGAAGVIPSLLSRRFRSSG